MPETENNVHSLSLRGQNKATIASCMYSHWSEASPQWSSKGDVIRKGVAIFGE